MSQKIVILDGIRSAYNVGAIFRTADGAGVERVYLIGPTPTPIDRFGRPQPEIEKTSLGAARSMPWEHVGESDSRSGPAALALISKLQSDGYAVVVVEQVAEATSLSSFTVPEKVAYVFGTEVEGVQAEVIAAADQCLEIPLLGSKESLNVSVTAGIVLFH